MGAIAVDVSRRRLLFADQLLTSPGPYSYIRAINLTSGYMINFAGRNGTSSIGYAGPMAEGSLATNTSLGAVSAIAVNASSGDVYIAEPALGRIRVISGMTQRIATVAGSGGTGCPVDGQLAATSPFASVQGLLVDPGAGRLLVSLGGGCNQVVSLTSTGGAFVVTVVAGRQSAGIFDGDGGAAVAAGLANPSGLAFTADSVAGTPSLVIAEKGAHVLRAVSSSNIATLIGEGGVPGYLGDGSAAGAPARLNQPLDVVATLAGDLLLVDGMNYVLRVLRPDGSVALLAGQPGVAGSASGSTDYIDATAAALGPARLAYDSIASALYFSDTRAGAVRMLRCVPTLSSSSGLRFSVSAGSWTGCAEVSSACASN